MAPMLRRHAGRLARMACEVSYRALDGEGGVPMVLCSRYGEVSRSVELLSALAIGAELSPTSFGLSVHNATCGLFAMARKDRANCIALAAGEESAECGILEACALLDDGEESVLVVVADCPLPDIYRPFASGDDPPFAWAALVESPGNDSFSLSWQVDDLSDSSALGSGPLGVLRFLLGEDRELRNPTPHRTWRWSRDG